MKKIYIIGDIPNVIDSDCEYKFYKAQLGLSQLGFSVVNPIERLTSDNMNCNVALRKNLQELTLCDAVYILPCININDDRKNLEIKYALKFNLLVIHGLVDLSTGL